MPGRPRGVDSVAASGPTGIEEALILDRRPPQTRKEYGRRRRSSFGQSFRAENWPRGDCPLTGDSGLVRKTVVGSNFAVIRQNRKSLFCKELT